MFKDDVSCCENFLNLDTFSENEKVILQWRSNLWEKMNNILTICQKHKKKIFVQYELGKVCENPFKLHTQKRHKGLNTSDFQMAVDYRKFSKGNINLPPGTKLCVECKVKVKKDIEVI